MFESGPTLLEINNTYLILVNSWSTQNPIRKDQYQIDFEIYSKHMLISVQYQGTQII